MVVLLVMIALPTSAQEIGLQLYSLRNEFKKDVPSTFAKIQSWGITKVEDGNDGTQGYTFDAYKKLLKKYGLEMVSTSASFEELKNEPRKALERAKAYGAKFMVCFWIPHQESNFTVEDAQKALEVFNTAGKIFKGEGVTLAYHPHGYEFKPYKNETIMDYMIQNADYFDFEMDVFWFALPGENPVEWLKKYPKKFKLMHLKDCKKNVGINHTGKTDVENNVVLGTGQVDIAGVVSQAKKIGIKYLFIEDESSKVLHQIPLSITYLKNLK